MDGGCGGFAGGEATPSGTRGVLTLGDVIQSGSPGVGEFTFGGLGGSVAFAGTTGCSKGSTIWLRVVSTTFPSRVSGETARTGEITNRGVFPVAFVCVGVLVCTGVFPRKVFSQLTSRSESFAEFSFSQYAIRSRTGAVIRAVRERSEPRKVCSQLASFS